MTLKTTGQSAQTKAAFWQHYIEEHNRISLSQVAYCRANSLALSTFQYWKRKLKTDSLQKPARFYPLTAQITPPKEHTLAPSGIAMRVSNDEVRVEIAEEFSASALKELLVVLRQR
jgi:hypothetical protein